MSNKKIPLVEAFGPTIQGEGVMIGIQTYFARFGLCDYRCKMCDSLHAVEPRLVKANARWLTQQDIYKEIESIRKPNSTDWITFSGGNPCIHDLSELVLELKSHDWLIAVETQGTEAPEWLQETDVITVSPKGPGMGETTDFEVLDKFVDRFFSCNVNMKIVVFDQRDLEFAKLVFERYESAQMEFTLSLGNMHPPGMDEGIDWSKHNAQLIGTYKMLFEDIKCDPTLSQMRFLPQWHHLVWGNEKGK